MVVSVKYSHLQKVLVNLGKEDMNRKGKVGKAKKTKNNVFFLVVVVV